MATNNPYRGGRDGTKGDIFSKLAYIPKKNLGTTTKCSSLKGLRTMTLANHHTAYSTLALTRCSVKRRCTILLLWLFNVPVNAVRGYNASSVQELRLSRKSSSGGGRSFGKHIHPKRVRPLVFPTLYHRVASPKNVVSRCASGRTDA